METKERPCVVCAEKVQVESSLPDDEVVCILHFFSEDVSEEWEADEFFDQEGEE